MKKIFLTMALAIGLIASAQVKIGNNPTAINDASLLELESSTQGINLPKLVLTSTIVAAPLAGGVFVEGMIVYNTNTTNTGTNDVTSGLYVSSTNSWVKLGGTPVLKLKIVTGTTIDFTTGEDIFVFTNTGVVLTLPAASLYTNKVLYIRNESGSSVSYVTTMPVAITNITATGAQQVFSNGTDWHLIAGKN